MGMKFGEDAVVGRITTTAPLSKHLQKYCTTVYNSHYIFV